MVFVLVAEYLFQRHKGVLGVSSQSGVVELRDRSISRAFVHQFWRANDDLSEQRNHDLSVRLNPHWLFSNLRQ